MKILVACEESQAVTIEFRKLGHEAYSCDLLPCSGGHPEWHLQQDVVPLLKEKWDMIIAFPPCTHLCVSGARHFEQKRLDGRQQQGIDFFMLFANADCQKIAIENPIGIMSNIYKKPSQIIQPWMFGDKFSKSTCLWLKGLPNLEPTNIVEKGEFIEWIDKKTGKIKRQAKWYMDALKKARNSEERSILRSKTFPGIARAMANQWGNLERDEEKMKQSCKLCSGYYTRANDNYIYYIEKNKLNISYYPIKEVIANRIFEIELNFCPLCGKQLNNLEKEQE